MAGIKKEDMKVLVAEDFAVMRIIAVDMLKKLGFSKVDAVECGGDAYNLMAKEKYHLVLTDWNMPDMSGLELLEKIRADADKKDAIVILVTSEAKKEQVIQAAKAGVNGYVLKPFTIEDLEKKINKAIYN